MTHHRYVHYHNIFLEYLSILQNIWNRHSCSVPNTVFEYYFIFFFLEYLNVYSAYDSFVNIRVFIPGG